MKTKLNENGVLPMTVFQGKHGWDQLHNIILNNHEFQYFISKGKDKMANKKIGLNNPINENKLKHSENFKMLRNTGHCNLTEINNGAFG